MLRHTQVMFRTALLVYTGALAISGCAQPMCQRARPASAIAQDTAAENLDAAYWAALLLSDDTHDCRGRSTYVASPSAVHSPQTKVHARPRQRAYTAADVVLSAPLHNSPSQRLVWLKAQRTQGFVSGPIALVSVSPHRVDVLAMGPLRLPEGNVELQYVNLHEFFAVRVDVTACGAKSKTQSQMCRQFMRIMPNNKGELCAGLSDEADMELAAVHELPSERRLWARRVEHAAQVELCQGTVILTESAALKEYHLKRVSMPPRMVRQAEAIRSMRWENNSWQPSDKPLWEMMAQTEMPARL